jgi:hypothetical protein
MERKVGFRVLTGQGANIDTTTASGRLVLGIFAARAEFEREPYCIDSDPPDLRRWQILIFATNSFIKK